MRKLKWGVSIAAIMLALSALAFSLLSQSRGVDYLSYSIVDSLQHVRFDDVDEALVPYLSQSFWEVDLTELKHSLEQVNWIENATIKRSWPGYLEISIDEHNPIARWGDKDLISQDGEIFRPVSQQGFEHLIHLQGDRLQAPALLAVLETFEEKLAALNWQVVSLSQQVDGVFRLKFDSGQELIVDSANWATKLPRFVKAYPMLSKKLVESAQSFDLRYSNGVAVKVSSPSSQML
ncbi:cell division protein FtsQ/DivIB [Thiomicrospira pelophila]|uniref:cell division protein FtsQ/DivIB n=1 Tax=Thiomicrospira pelophila TaxID=934 RepID=UPI0004A6F446|nr:cell division protein FtsQ/DivIB [Thiomicrospira pelophila]